MGQYFTFVNTTKKEVLSTRTLDTGLKLWEVCANRGAEVLAWLVAKGPQDGVGLEFLSFNLRYDLKGAARDEQSQRINEEANTPLGQGKVFHTCGRWAGDRIALVGDYDPSKLYAKSKHFKDISAETIEEFNRFVGKENAVGRNPISRMVVRA